jgi:hypothetical protein
VIVNDRTAEELRRTGEITANSNQVPYLPSDPDIADSALPQIDTKVATENQADLALAD